MKYDFKGYATKANVKCADGLIIGKNAFKECDGRQVPLVWQHRSDDIQNVLGHAILENRDDGVYAYGIFNNTKNGLHAKEIVKSGNINSLSIFANNLAKQGSTVTHGVIREVSLCLVGMNPEARIEHSYIINHADDGTESITTDETSGVIYHSLELDDVIFDDYDDDDTISHADAQEINDQIKKLRSEMDEDTLNRLDDITEFMDGLDDDQKAFVLVCVANELGGDDEVEEYVSEAPESDAPTVQAIYDSFDDNQKETLFTLINNFKEIS